MKIEKNHKNKIRSSINWLKEHKFVGFILLVLGLVTLSGLIQKLTPPLKQSQNNTHLNKASKNFLNTVIPGKILSPTDKERLVVVSSKTKNNQTYLYLAPRETVKNDLVVVDDNQEVLFTKTNLAYNPDSNIKDYLKKFGGPNMIMSAPKISPAVYVYVFLNQGVAVVAHKQTGVVEQIWRFKPMPKKLFLTTWGKNLSPKDTPAPPDEVPI